MALAYYANEDPSVDIYFSLRDKRITLGRREWIEGSDTAKWRDRTSLPLDAPASVIGKTVVDLLRPVERSGSKLSALPTTQQDAFEAGHLLGVWTKIRKRSPYRVGATQVGMRRFALRYVSREASETRLGKEVLDLWKAVCKARWPQGPSINSRDGRIATSKK